MSIIPADRKTRPADSVAEVEVTLQDKQVVEVELSFRKPQGSSVWGKAVDGVQLLQPPRRSVRRVRDLHSLDTSAEYENHGRRSEKGKPVHVELSLEPKYHFAGRVTNTAGKPQPNRSVLAIWKDPSGKNKYSSYTETNSFGRYNFSSPFEVAERILINDGGMEDTPEHHDVKHGRDDVDFRLGRSR